MKSLLLILVLSLSVMGQKTVLSGNGKLSGNVTTVSPTSSTLNTGLQGCWNLSEASGSAIDSSVGGNNLTENGGTIGTAAGPGSNNARVFNGSLSQFLSHADTSALRFGGVGDWTLNAWVYLSDNTLDGIVIGKDGEASGNREFQFFYTNTSGQRFFDGGFTATDNGQAVTANTFGTPANATFYMLTMTWTGTTTKVLSIQVSNGTADTFSVGANFQASGTAPFEIGARSYAGAEAFFTGRIALVGKWNRVLDSGEKTYLYNSGNGRQCPY